MKPLNHTVGLRMVGSCFRGERSEETDERLPETKGKLPTTISGDYFWTTETGYPTTPETHDSAVMSGIGTASGQRVQRSTIVKRYRQPWEIGKGPTIYTCTCPKRPEGASKT